MLEVNIYSYSYIPSFVCIFTKMFFIFFFYKAQKNLLNVILEFVILPLSDKTLLSAITICRKIQKFAYTAISTSIYIHHKRNIENSNIWKFFPIEFHIWFHWWIWQEDNNAVSADEIFKINSNK